MHYCHPLAWQPTCLRDVLAPATPLPSHLLCYGTPLCGLSSLSTSLTFPRLSLPAGYLHYRHPLAWQPRPPRDVLVSVSLDGPPVAVSATPSSSTFAIPSTPPQAIPAVTSYPTKAQAAAAAMAVGGGGGGGGGAGGGAADAPGSFGTVARQEEGSGKEEFYAQVCGYHVVIGFPSECGVSLVQRLRTWKLCMQQCCPLQDFANCSCCRIRSHFSQAQDLFLELLQPMALSLSYPPSSSTLPPHPPRPFVSVLPT